MAETYGSEARVLPSGGRALFAVLLVVDVAVTLFPPLSWAAGGRAWSALLYAIGGSAVVLVSVLVMYTVDRARATSGEA